MRNPGKILLWATILAFALAFGVYALTPLLTTPATVYDKVGSDSTEEWKVNSADPSPSTDHQTDIVSNTQDHSQGTVFGLGEDIEANGYTIKFGPDYQFAGITNTFSDDYGKTVVKLLFTESNHSGKSGNFNHYAITLYSPSGYSVNTSMGALFDDSSVKARSIMPGVSQTTYFYFLYEGSGEYTMEIDDHTQFGSTITVKFNIQ